jgi:hypothetical protein
MKYIKKFENLAQDKIGNFAILKDTLRHINSNNKAIWHNIYGKIVNIGKEDIYRSTEVYLFRPLCELDDNLKIFIKKSEETSGYIYPTFEYTQEEYDMWVLGEYTELYDNKKEFDNAVDKIEIEKNINNYNL